MPTSDRHRIALIGGGPRALMLLERLAAHAAPDTAMQITMIDPHPAGAGRIWRTGQSPYLQLNSTAADVSIFNDDSCDLSAPSAGGPALDVWVEGVRNGEITPPWEPDAVTAAEIARLTGADFPSRRLHSLYLTWALDRVIETMPERVTLDLVRDTVTHVEEQDLSRGLPHVLNTRTGTRIEADVVVYLVGHTDATSSPETSALAAASRDHGLIYHGPAYTADDDHTDLTPGLDVLVRGLGLAAIDLIVMLTQGRGGHYEPVEEDRHLPASHQRLRYVASGREPHLLLGSRRGVPYRSKSMQHLDHPPAPVQVLTADLFEQAAARGEVLDLEDDLLPLIHTELSLAHHRELFLVHPERTLGSWEAAEQAILTLEESSPELNAYLAGLIPDPLDRFCVAQWNRPLASLAVASCADLDQVLTEHINTDLDVHLDPERTPTLAVFHALLQIHVLLADAPETVLSRRTREHGLPNVWRGFFSYLASGPPPERLHQLLALQQAGVLGFLGPDVSVDVTEHEGAPRFRAQSPAVAEESFATALVDAWLPANDAHHTSNPALSDLATRAGLAGGRIRVNPVGAVLAADGTRLPSTWSLGAPTSSPDAGAFARPHTNAVPFRSTDRTAADILTHLRTAPTHPFALSTPSKEGA